MPIKFRCPFCEQFLGISRAKAGEITDCPTCGRTIRVPLLDGTVEPLPDLEIDLQDDNLRDALGALAQLEALTKAAEEPSVKGAKAATLNPTPHPEVIDSPQLRPIIVASPEKQVEPDLYVDEFDPDQALGEIAKLAAENHGVPNAVSRTANKSSLPVLLPITAILFFGLGFLIGRSSVTNSVLEPDTQPAAKPQPAINSRPTAEQEDPAAVVQAPGHAVQGVVTFVDASGESRPDRGSRIFVLPLAYDGETKLPNNGIGIGADVAIQAEFEAAVRATGGGFAVAGANGEFRIAQLQPGEYKILLASKFQPRSADPLDPEIRDFLGQYVQQPEKFIGRVQFQLEDVKITPDETVEVDVEFLPG